MYTTCHSQKVLGIFRAMMLVLMLSLGTMESRASHIAGGDLTYQSLGNGTYLVTYTLYRDCFGITAPTTAFLNVASASCGSPTQNITMTQVPGTGQEITPTCSTTTSTCNGGSSAGIQQYQYTALVSLPYPCPDWHMWVDDCCRNQAITTVQNASGDGLYIDAYLDNTVYSSSSPTFGNVPIVFFCIGQTNYFNQGAVDADGDSLAYYFIPPRQGENDPLVFNAGYSISNPLSSSPAVSINSATGDIAVTPTQQEIGLLSVVVEEYRNGVLIGRVMRDIQVYTVACSNTLPSISGVNGTQSFSTSACAGAAPLCFNITSSDNNSNDSLWLTWNQGIPGATFSPGTGSRPVGQFCWAPTPADARPNPYTFTVTVHDNSCPSPGVQTYSFSILVSSLNFSVTSSTSVTCFGDSSGSATVFANGVAPYSYAWQPASLSGASVSNLPAGNYNVVVSDASGCSGSRSFTITQPAAVQVAVTSSSTQCAGQTGSATAVASGGTGPYSYSWNTTPVQSTATASNLASGTYTCTVTDSRGCQKSNSVAVTSSTGLAATSSSTASTCTASNGSISVSVSSGTGPFTYSWSPNVSTSASATGLAPGNYTITVTDVNGCSTVLNQSVSIVGGPLTAGVTSVDASCLGNDGSITVNMTNGTAPYSYNWSPNVSSSSVASNLTAGQYAVVVTDANGCSQSFSGSVASGSFSASVSNVRDVTCPGFNDGSATVVTAGGTGPYNYMWMPGMMAGATESSLTAGSYSIQVTDATGCIAYTSATIGTAHSNPVITFATSSDVCASGAPVVLNVASPAGGTYSGTGVSGGSFNPSVTGAGVATIDYNYTDANGCSSSASTTITVVADPTVQFTNISTSCVGNSPVTLTTGSPAGGTYSGPGVSNGVFDPAAAGGPGTYTITYTYTNATGCTGSATGTVTVGNPATVNIVMTPGTGCSANTVYIGYTASYITLTAQASLSGLSYQWYKDGQLITGAIDSVLLVAEGGNYSVTVSDGGGCSASANAPVTVNAVDVRCGHDLKKVIICHVPPGNPGNPQTLCIAPSAVPAHLTLHPGDCLGPCPNSRLDGSATDEAHSLAVSPNPFNNIVNISFEVYSDQTIEIGIYDMEGRLVQELVKNDFASDSHYHNEFNLSNLNSGMYFVKFSSGDVVEFRKITKTN